MAVDSSLVDRIVRGVLQEMQRPAKPVAPTATPAPVSVPAAESGGLRLPQAIITAEVIEAQVPRGTSQILVSPKAILTPAALDVARSRKLRIQREAAAKPAVGAPSGRLAVVVKSSPVLDRLLTDRTSGWTRELLGCPDDAAKLAISAVCRGESEVVVIFATQNYRAACLANRHERVKAVAVATVDELTKAAAQMRVNVVCVDPTNRGDFEIRRLLDAAAKLKRAGE